jgi:hypothetical protein
VDEVVLLLVYTHILLNLGMGVGGYFLKGVLEETLFRGKCLWYMGVKR